MHCNLILGECKQGGLFYFTLQSPANAKVPSALQHVCGRRIHVKVQPLLAFDISSDRTRRQTASNVPTTRLVY